MNQAYKTFLYFLKEYFEPISMAYHIIFFCFLLWVSYVKPKSMKLPVTFVNCLGLYVMFYGFIIFFYGPHIINHTYPFNKIN